MANLRLYIQQQPQFNNQFQQVYYAGANPQSLQVVVGLLPTARRWPNYGTFIDVTDSIGNLDDLSLEFTLDTDNEGNFTTTGFNTKKSTSGTVVFEDTSYQLLKKWLVEDVSGSINEVAVKVHDTGCDIWYEGYAIRAQDLQWCESDVCIFNINLKQKDERLNCIQSTLIEDNWNGWFQTVPANGKKHPRFPYCNEIRPNGLLVAIWLISSFMFLVIDIILIPIILVINAVILIVNAIIAIINAIDAILGTGSLTPLGYIDPQDILENQRQAFVEAAGCGREHPAPLVRDYIKNVCDKCGVIVDAQTAPIFFADTLTIDTSTRGLVTVSNPYTKLCYLNIPNQRGIRRFSLPSPFLAPDYNETDYWIDQNAPLLTLDNFLNYLKGVFNAEWILRNGKLYFNRKDMFKYDTPLYDFSTNGADRFRILQGVCFEYDGTTAPAYTIGIYQQDGADSCGDEARSYMNGTVSHGNTIENPTFKGQNDISQQFGATRFRHDGITPDYVYDAAQATLNGQGIASLLGQVDDALQRIPDHCLLLRDETATLPKLLIWDGQSYDRAAVVKDIETWTGPAINPKYNSLPWNQKHTVNTFVKGQNVNPFYNPVAGHYKVVNWIGNAIKDTPARLVNYPMYLAPDFEGGLWDLFHWIDDPKYNPRNRTLWKVVIDLCCEDLEKLNVGGEGSGVNLGQPVKLPIPYTPEGIIRKITVNYSPEDDLGSNITIEGR
jgi:hypothetical protein